MTISGWVFMISVGFNAAIRFVLSQPHLSLSLILNYIKFINVSIQFNNLSTTKKYIYGLLKFLSHTKIC